MREVESEIRLCFVHCEAGYWHIPVNPILTLSHKHQRCSLSTQSSSQRPKTLPQLSPHQLYTSSTPITCTASHHPPPHPHHRLLSHALRQWTAPAWTIVLLFTFRMSSYSSVTAREPLSLPPHQHTHKHIPVSSALNSAVTRPPTIDDTGRRPRISAFDLRLPPELSGPRSP
jgi:hypothetical protein